MYVYVSGSTVLAQVYVHLIVYIAMGTDVRVGFNPLIEENLQTEAEL